MSSLFKRPFWECVGTSLALSVTNAVGNHLELKYVVALTHVGCVQRDNDSMYHHAKDSRTYVVASDSIKTYAVADYDTYSHTNRDISVIVHVPDHPAKTGSQVWCVKGCLWKNFLGRKQGFARDESVQPHQSGLLGFTTLDMFVSIETWHHGVFPPDTVKWNWSW